MSTFRVPYPRNESILDYAPGSVEYTALHKALAELKSKKLEIAPVINGKEVKSGQKISIISPHNHKQILGYYYQSTQKEIKLSIKSALAAQKYWESMPWQHRASIFLKAADLLAGPYRHTMNAACMLAHSKTIFQAEIDAVCELVDFWRFNAYFLEQIYGMQPENSKVVWNRMDHRPLEGFVVAITPFNFVSINGNLPTAPAMAGNVIVWKPASVVAYTSYFIMKILREAGLPNGVINMLFPVSSEFGNATFRHPNLAGIHFTGSTGVFQKIWRTIGENISGYKTYPRIVGETGGKDFILAHASANPKALVTAIVRGAFEYQGQKCSAASRCYIPKSLWKAIKEGLISQTEELKMGDPEDNKNFVSAVIDQNAFENISGYIEYAKKSRDCKIIAGGKCDKSKGWFIRPTIVVTSNPKSRLLEEEIFGPVLTIYVYDDRNFVKTLNLIDTTSPYALTGAVFATDRNAVQLAEQKLRQAAGNFYINDKPTGAVVGQQPFGGARASGTNDKAGGIQNMIRWVSPRSIKENLCPPENYRYPFMG
jgi:1-pyrroline-5-carboxylate dehydrogenase